MAPAAAAAPGPTGTAGADGSEGTGGTGSGGTGGSWACAVHAIVIASTAAMPSPGLRMRLHHVRSTTEDNAKRA